MNLAETATRTATSPTRAQPVATAGASRRGTSNPPWSR